VQIPDDVSRELTEAYIKDPKGTEAKLRVNPPTLKREGVPKGGKRARKARPSPVAKIEPHAAAAPNGKPSANGGHAAKAAPARARKAARTPARAK
jgi:hypothetical protein